MIRIISFRSIAGPELDRFERVAGYRPEDWMQEVYDNAIETWTDEDGTIDIDSVISEVSNNTDILLDFLRENYPEDLKEEPAYD